MALERICLNCSLAICDDRDARCRFEQIGRQKRSYRRQRRFEDEQIKRDVIDILGRLVGMKAVDDAIAAARK